MSDLNLPLGTGAFGPEPARDVELGDTLASHLGRAPMDSVNWGQLASRISARVNTSAWWTYAASWERRLIPIAIAAGVLSAFALWSTEASARTSTALPDGLAFVISGTPSATAARQFARELTSGIDITAPGVPE